MVSMRAGTGPARSWVGAESNGQVAESVDAAPPVCPVRRMAPNPAD